MDNSLYTQKINLFKDVSVKNTDFQSRVHKLKVYCIFFTIVVLALTVVAFYIEQSYIQKTNDSIAESTRLAQSLKSQALLYAKKSAIAHSVSVVKQASAADIAAYTKFTDFQDFLVSQQINASIKTISITDKKSFTLTLLFKDDVELLEFINSLNRGTFAAKFKNFGIAQFRLSEVNQEKESTKELNLRGEYL